MALGRLLGEGRTADVHEYGAGRVIKLLRPGFRPALLKEEAEMTALAAEAGAPAPGVHGLENHGGRKGIVMDAAPGESLLDLILSDLDRWRQWAEIMARSHAAILDLRAGEAPDVRDILRAAIEAASDLPDVQRRRVLRALDGMEGGDGLLHGDFHPRNVFVDGSTTTVIDWGNVSRGPAAADIARTLHLISPTALPPDLPHRDEISRLLGDFRSTYSATVVELTGTMEADVDRWTLPILAARLNEGIEWEHTTLLSEIEVLTA